MMAVTPGMMNHLPKDFPQVYMPFLTEILLKKPDNIPEFAAEYFERKVQERDGPESQANLPSSRVQLLQQQQASGSRESIPPKQQTSSKVEEMLAWRKPEIKLPSRAADEDEIVEIKHLFEPEVDEDFDENDEDVKSFVFVGKVLPVHSKTKQVYHSLESTMLPPAIESPSTHLDLPEPEDYYKEPSSLSLKKMNNDQQEIEKKSDREGFHSIRTHGSVSEVEDLPMASKSVVRSYTSLLSKQDAAMDMSEQKVKEFRQYLEAPTTSEATQTESGFTLLEIEDREVDSSVLDSGFIPPSPANTSDSRWFEQKKTEKRFSNPVVPKVKIESTSLEYDRDEQKEEGRFSITSLERHSSRLSQDRSEGADNKYSIGSVNQSMLEAHSGGIVPRPTSFEYDDKDEQKEEGRFSITSMERHSSGLSQDRSERADNRYSIASVSQSVLDADSGGTVPRATSFEYDDKDEQKEEGRFRSMERHSSRQSQDRSQEAEKRYSIGSVSQSALEAGSGGIVPTGASGLRSFLFQQSMIRNRLSGDLTTQEEDENAVTVSSLGYIQSRPFERQEFLDREESDFGDDDISAFDSDSSTTSIPGERGIRSLWFQKRVIKDERKGRLLTMTGRRGIMRKDSVQKLIVKVPVFQHHLIETTATTPRLGFRGFRAFLFVQAMEKEEKNLKLFKDREEYILN